MFVVGRVVEVDLFFVIADLVVVSPCFNQNVRCPKMGLFSG